MGQFQKMTHEERLSTIDRELRTLQAEAIRSGYSARQVEHFAECFVRVAVKRRREKLVKMGLALAVIMFMCYVLLQFGPPYRMAASMARTGLIKVSKTILCGYHE